MHHVMFDIDGTLLQSDGFDTELFSAAVLDETGIDVDSDWSRYTHVTDAGILHQLLTEHSLSDDIDSVFARVKRNFVERVSIYLEQNPACEVPGAGEFLSRLKSRDDVRVSIATGGWGETARLKLASADLLDETIPLASCNDHPARSEIMRVAARLAGVTRHCSYFGDGSWDRSACAELGFNFILVGCATQHHQQIDDFRDPELALGYIGF